MPPKRVLISNTRYLYSNMPVSHNNDGNRIHDCCYRNQLIKFSFRKSHNNTNSSAMLSGHVQFKHCIWTHEVIHTITVYIQWNRWKRLYAWFILAQFFCWPIESRVKGRSAILRTYFISLPLSLSIRWIKSEILNTYTIFRCATF